MLYSIIVPIYKVERYLEKCIDSLLHQTYKDIEIILVDDESPDKCPEICDKYVELDNRIKVIHKKNGGLSDARNKGLEIARGEYVLFVDSDDYIERDTCEHFCSYAEKKYDIIIGDAIVENGHEIFHIEPSDVVYSGKEYLKKALLQKKAPMATWLNIYRREFLLDHNLQFKYGILHEDEEFTPRAFLEAQSVICSGVCFYHYVIHENSITTQKDKRRNAKDLYETCCDLEKKYLKIEDVKLRNLLLDSLVCKLLNMFRVGKLHQYGKEYIYKSFVKRNAKLSITKKKALVYRISPQLYFYIVNIAKLGKGKK
jgi:glycosyltransferase involved in cell wall biosynthesis